MSAVESPGSSSPATLHGSEPGSVMHDQVLFWGCFIALVTTAFGFIARMFLISAWAAEFNLDQAQAGQLAGIGIWPFAVSIIGFSLIIDRIGYKASMFIAFVGHITWAIMGVSAYFISQNGDKSTAYSLLYWGSLILGLGNGTVEAFINPVVATMFNRDKTKWLNILHAGWPGGLVVAGIVTIYIDHVPWWMKVGMIAVPAVVYVVMLAPLKFPVQERVSSGVSFKDMLSEFGILGALVVGFLVTLQLMDFFSMVEFFTMQSGDKRVLADWAKYLFIGIGVSIVVAFGVYTQALGRILMFFLILIMMPLATTEIGTDGWITGIMEGIAKEQGFHPGWILVYTSAIMMVLRFFAGPIIHALSPLGLLTVSAALAIAGLYSLSLSAGLMIFAAATLYGFGKTFFWPTMLGVVSEQMPKGGALTLNAISGIGMLAVGVLGFPYIGSLQANKQIAAIESNAALKAIPEVYQDGKLNKRIFDDRTIYEFIHYKAINTKKLDEAIAKSKLDQAHQGLAEEIAGAKADPAKVEAIITREKLSETEADGVRGAATRAKPVYDSVAADLARSTQGALANMALFPCIMLAGYLILIVYFQSKGGYKPVELAGGGTASAH